MKKIIIILLFIFAFNVSARADHNLHWIIQYWYYVIEGHGKLPKHNGLVGQKTNHYNTRAGKVTSWNTVEMGTQPTMAQFNGWSDAANNWQATTNQINRKLAQNIQPVEKAMRAVMVDFLEGIRTNAITGPITVEKFNKRLGKELLK